MIDAKSLYELAVTGRIDGFAHIRNWEGEPVPWVAIENAKTWFQYMVTAAEVAGVEWTSPFVAPTGDGEIMFEFEGKDSRILNAHFADGDVTYTKFVMDDDDDKCFGGPLHHDDVVDHLKWLAGE